MYRFVKEVMTDILRTKEIIQRPTLGILKGIKNTVSISIAISGDILIRNENIASKGHKTNPV